MSQETRHEIIEGKKIKKLQEADEVRREVIQWVLEGKASQMQELRGKVQKVRTVRQLFNPMVFVMHDGVLCYNKHWVFDPKIIPGSCDKLRSYWAGPYKIIKKLSPALAEVIEMYERGKPRPINGRRW